MKVTFAADITLILDEEDSAEEFSHEVKQSINREWIRFPEQGESVNLHIKRIDA